MPTNNIIFSSTRQWNPGDEFILMGIRGILSEVGADYNAIIFNRNPDVRSCFQDKQIFKRSKLPNDFWNNSETISLEANLKFGFFDNSLKPDMDCSFADWVVLAGTPEWCNGKMYDLYAAVIRHQLPLMILGVGGNCDIYHPSFREVIAKAKVFIVRDQSTYDAACKEGFVPTLLPCPALLAAPKGRERLIESVRKVALIYQATRDESVIWNGFSYDAYNTMLQIHRDLIQNRPDLQFEIICHYVDELPLAVRDFQGLPIRYSYDVTDYIDIYASFDFVVGSRVHGLGIAASLGIPGVALAHDSRGATCEGFLSTILSLDQGNVAADVIDNAIVRAPQTSIDLGKHKAKTMLRYKSAVAKGLTDSTVSYAVPELIVEDRQFNLRDLRAIYEALEVIKHEPKTQPATGPTSV